MAKYPIKWHEECLKNQERYLVERKSEAKRQIEALTKDIENLEADVLCLRLQIQRAKRLKKDGFDPDKFQPEKGGE